MENVIANDAILIITIKSPQQRETSGFLYGFKTHRAPWFIVKIPRADARAATFFSPLLSLRRCTTRYNCCNIFEAEGVADSQFNFMAYTVPPFAAAYLYVRHLLSSFYIYSPLRLPPPFKKLFYSASSKLSNHFPVFLELFKNLSIPLFSSIFSVASISSILSSFSCLLSEIARSTVCGRWLDGETDERSICNWNAKKSRGLNRLL